LPELDPALGGARNAESGQPARPGAGARGDAANALLCGTGYNLRLILNWLRRLLRALLQLFAVSYLPA
jgi:hypothetical protein